MDNAIVNVSSSQSPKRNPFSLGDMFKPASLETTFFKDIGGKHLADLNDEDFAPRESLDILPNSTLIRDSLTSDFFSTSFKNSPMSSPRESLGILNISSMDLGRESIGIFNINNPIFRREFSNNDKSHNAAFSDFEKALISPLLLQENSVPKVISEIEGKIGSCSLTDFDKGFLLPHSRKITGISSRSSGASANPSFNSRSLEEPSKIYSINSVPKEIKPSIAFCTDLLNEAFQLSQGGDAYSVLYKSTSTDYSIATGLKNTKNRILSLPLIFEENKMLKNIHVGNKTQSDEELIYRGIKVEENLDDSVFIHSKKLLNEDTSFNCQDKSFDEEWYTLDLTPQPNWDEWDSSKSNGDEIRKSPSYSKEGVSKKVDKMLGMQPINLEEKLKLKNNSKCVSTCLENISFSQNISKISRGSQCSGTENASNNFSQDLSKISRTSEENASRLIKNLSDIINEKENLSNSQKKEGRHILHCLADLLHDTGNKSFNSEDSGHSSVEGLLKNAEISNEKVLEALDLSCKNKSSLSCPAKNPPPYVSHSPNQAMLGTNSTKSGNNGNKPSAKSHSVSSIASLRRHSSISHNKVSLGTEKLKKAKAGIVSSKKEPLRAVLPIETMAKTIRNAAKISHSSITPEKNDGVNKFVLQSKKTSTPLQEPKLKPMAASTPTVHQSTDFKENTTSNFNSGKPKFTRLFSYQPKAPPALDQPTYSRKSGEIMVSKNAIRKSAPKIDGTKFARRNSVTENVPNRETDVAGSPRVRRSFSTGKEPKIMSALNKARQNILNSPYYNPRKSSTSEQDKVDSVTSREKVGNDLTKCSLELKSLSKVPSKKLGKENLKP